MEGGGCKQACLVLTQNFKLEASKSSVGSNLQCLCLDGFLGDVKLQLQV